MRTILSSTINQYCYHILNFMGCREFFKICSWVTIQITLFSKLILSSTKNRSCYHIFEIHVVQPVFEDLLDFCDISIRFTPQNIFNLVQHKIFTLLPHFENTCGAERNARFAHIAAYTYIIIFIMLMHLVSTHNQTFLYDL